MAGIVQLVMDLPFAGLCFYVVWSWVRWARSLPVGPIGVRSVVGTIAFFAASISVALAAFLRFHAHIAGGYHHYHPIELFCIRVGLLAALTGFIGAYLTKGKLMIPALISSSLALFIWFMAGVTY